MLTLDRHHSQTIAEAEDVAIAALTYLADREKELARFLAVSGIDASEIRAAAAEPEFLAGVLAHIVHWEPLLLDFAATTGRQPEAVTAAAETLSDHGRSRDGR